MANQRLTNIYISYR